MNNLYHYSQMPIVNLSQRQLVFSDTYDEARDRSKYYLCPFMKPDGFWFSPEDATQKYDVSWYDYCLQESEYFSAILRYKYHILPVPTANLLILDTISKMYEFRKRYLLYFREPLLRSLAICWQKVALDYQGILIAPYHYELRLNSDFTWYSSWDCASGCVWDISAIQSISLVQGG